MREFVLEYTILPVNPTTAYEIDLKKLMCSVGFRIKCDGRGFLEKSSKFSFIRYTMTCNATRLVFLNAGK